MNAQQRLSALRRRLALEEVPAILLMGISNMRYITGFENVFDEGINSACLITPEIARFYTDRRYSEAAERAAEGTPWTVRIQRESLYIELCEELTNDSIGEIALEPEVPYGRFKFISEQFGGSVKVVGHWVEELRQVKESHEIERIAAAASLADRAFDHILGHIKTGMTEREVALELEFFMRRNGSDGMPFPPIVASGPNSAKPHATVSDRVIATGDVLKMDFGARVQGYCSDMTRTVVIGRASERQREVYEAVLAANEAGLEAVRAGVGGAEVHEAARATLVERGMAELFTHGLGHGVGLDVHELPTLNPRSDDSIRAGSVVTIEPGVYEPGVAGVRIEDLVVVEEHGHRLLSHAPKTLIEI